ncbi:hypothetical protein SAMN05660485_00422 [Blastococcus fimeti]|nr:hypothetical protein SAMN05660485_00422 [Blastococcus fimeti]
MHTSRRTGLLAVCASVALLAACSSSTDEASSGSPLSTAPPGTYGTPLDETVAPPSAVATDEPVEVGPTDDGRVFVTYSGWSQDGAFQVSAYLPGVVENDGTCTLTMTSESGEATASGPASPDATSTACGGLSIAGADLGPGAWSAVVSYESGSSRASSDPIEVEIP